MAEFYSNGKLLLTSEYLVLDGATALAVPTKFGQSLKIVGSAESGITWKSYDNRQLCWFEDELSLSEIRRGDEGNSVKSTLVQILHVADRMNPNVLSDGFEVSTHLNFPRDWGLGSSSTLINNIAMWFGIDAFELLANTMGGSGYDIACAIHGQPILYCRERGIPTVQEIALDLPFLGNLYFIHLNRKQNSREAIENYRKNRPSDVADAIKYSNALTKDLIQARNLDCFMELLIKHESMVGGILKMQPVAEKLFPDFEGAIKSLGAWGGDFILAASENDPTTYFEQRGYHTVIPYSEMVK